jgi:hypothetical protein
MAAGELHLSQTLEAAAAAGGADSADDSTCFCSKACASFTHQLAAQLVNPLDRIKPSALQKALDRRGPVSHGPQQQQQQQQGVGAQGGGVTTMKAVIEVRGF